MFIAFRETGRERHGERERERGETGRERERETIGCFPQAS